MLPLLAPRATCACGSRALEEAASARSSDAVAGH